MASEILGNNQVRSIAQSLFLLFGASVLAWAQFPGMNGLGGSTYTCVDRDGDHYGTGSGCLGPDADDLDPAVQTGAQGILKYGSLNGFLAHLGYTPLREWFIDTTLGNDATCVSGGAPVGIGSPCLTTRTAILNLAAGDAVIFRAGTYTVPNDQMSPVTNGTSSNPIIFMAYPGESVLMTVVSNIVDRSWVTIDGIRFTTGCIAGGDASYSASTNAFHDISIRHIETFECEWGFIYTGGDNVLLEDSSMHDMNADVGGQHGLYGAAKGSLLASNNTVRRCLFYHNAWKGMHMNGNMAGTTVTQNISYSNGIANFDFQNGTHNSVISDNLSFQGGSSGGLVISVYPGTEGESTGCGPTQMDPCVCLPTPNLYGLCANDQTGNLIQNNTFIQGQFVYDGTNAGPVAVWVARQSTCTTPASLAANQGSNTFRNNIVMDYASAGALYPPIRFSDDGTGWPQSSTFDSNVVWQWDSSHRPGVLLYGSTSYPCNSMPSGVTFTNCINADPLVQWARPLAYTQPLMFNLRLQLASPALQAGSTINAPTYDVYGNAFVAGHPSIGAIELSLGPQGWTDLGANTVLTTAAALPNLSGALANCSGSTPPAYCAGSTANYSFLGLVRYVIQAQSGCANDFYHSVQLCTGGGHNDYWGNQQYYLDPVAKTMTRVSDPSPNQNNSGQVNPDGTSPASHTQQGLVYMPNENAVFKWGIGVGAAPQFQTVGWWINLSSQNPTWVQKGALPTRAGISGGNLVLDTSSDRESLIFVGYLENTIYRYDPPSDTWTAMPNQGNIMALNGGTCDVDPDNATLYCAGAKEQGGGGQTGGVYSYSLAAGSTYLATNITGTLSGCSGLYAVSNPGFKWNPISRKFVGYPGVGNSVTIFDPVALSCTTVTFSGGPSNPIADPYGIYDLFTFFPASGQFSAIGNATDHVFSLVVDEVPSSPFITPTSLPDGVVGSSYGAQTLTANTFGAGTITWNITAGSLPSGLSGCNGVTGPTCAITGTPTTIGSNAFTISASNTSGSATQTYTINIVGSNPSGPPRRRRDAIRRLH